MLKRNRRITTRLVSPNADPSEKALELQELASRQFARHLHDGPIQSVAALAMRANLATRQPAKDPAAASEELTNLEQIARVTTKELRYLQFILQPLSLETAGLATALQDLVNQEKDVYNQVIKAEINPNADFDLQLRDAELFFQIAAEAVANARLHAQAKTITVRLTRPEITVLLLEVADDGMGIDWTALESKPREKRGLGIDLMRLRAGLLGGELAISTNKDRGTTVRIAAPVK